MITVKELSETINKVLQDKVDRHEVYLTEYTQNFIKDMDTSLKQKASWGMYDLDVSEYYPNYNFKVTWFGYLLTILTLGMCWAGPVPTYREGWLIKGTGNVKLIVDECKKRGLKIEYHENPWDFSRRPRIVW